jgi:hypothetical protein
LLAPLCDESSSGWERSFPRFGTNSLKTLRTVAKLWARSFPFSARSPYRSRFGPSVPGRYRFHCDTEAGRKRCAER